MTTAVATAVRTFQIDAAHSEIGFQVRHLIGRVRGRFGDFNGSIDFDEDQPAHSSVRFTVQAASIDTNQPDRDTHLRSDDFFAAAAHPTLTFVSTAITPTGKQTFAVAGTLTIRGIARPVVIPVTWLGRARDPWGQDRVAFEGELTIDRKDFGLTWNAAIETGGFLVGDDVRVSLSIQAQAAPQK